MKKWYAYAVPPVDYRWQHLHSMHQVISSLASGDIEPPPEGFDAEALSYFQSNWETARMAAMAAGWDGEFRLAPRVFWVPVRDAFELGFVIKQDYCGVTYVISPVPMPWLGGADA